MKKKQYLGIAIACGLLLGTSQVWAAEVADFGDEDVVVTATRTVKKNADVAASTTVITAEMIKDSGAHSAADVLKTVNGIQYDSLGTMNQNMGTMSNNLIIRGYGDGTLVLVNGNPISYRTLYDLSSIAAENIERIEIIKGSGSVMYGSEAMGGVVNIITKKSQTENTVNLGFGNRASHQYGFNVGDENWRISYNKEVQNKSHDTSSPAISSKAELRYFTHDMSRENANISYNINDKWDLMYNYSQSIGHYDRIITGTQAGYTGKAAVGDLYQTRKYLTTQHNFQLNFADNDWKASIFNNLDTIESKGFTDKFKFEHTPYHTFERNNTYGLDAQKTWHLGDKVDLTTGFNAKRESYATSLTETTKARSNYDRNNWAVFAELDQKIDDKNSFVVGARETWTSGAYKNQNYSNFSASGSWLHKMDEENSLYASVAQSFMMPTFSQMYKSTDYAVPNPDLKPQKGINYELGWKQQHGAHNWQVALFHTKVRDNITATWDSSDPLNKFYTYNNEDFRNTGVELSWKIEDESPFSFDYGITYQLPQTKSDSVKKLTAMDQWENAYGRLQFTTGITYKLNKFTSNLNASYQCMRYSSESGPNQHVKPYLLTSLNFIYEPDKNSEISLAIDNVLSRRDRVSNSSSNYYNAPATFMLNYTYKF